MEELNLVEEYSIERLAEILADLSETQIEEVRQKTHLTYFEKYFETLDAHTIVIEQKYVDHDYLDDFSAYYVKCFHPYKRTCARLHFFKDEFDEATFLKQVTSDNDSDREALQSAYRGFIVVRPLPQNIIGRTCLEPYPLVKSGKNRRRYAAVRDYHPNLFGIPLTIRTLAFQQQDQIASACATSALWSAFQATSHLYQHNLPSPIEITRAATSEFPLRSRAVPSDGLTTEQMAHAIQSIGLEPYCIDLTDKDKPKAPKYAYMTSPHTLQAAVYAYVTSGIPALLLVRLEGGPIGNRETIGYHAVTITGYSLPESIEWSSAEDSTPQFLSTQIDKFYAHDDQVGPHARMKLGKDNSERWYLTTSWGLNGRHKDVRAYPLTLLLPLYNKIRIPSEDIYNMVQKFDAGLSGIFRVTQNLAKKGLLWSKEPLWSQKPFWKIRLTTVNAFKESLKKENHLSDDKRQKILLGAFPKYLWRATASLPEGPLIDILFDATDIASGKFICWYHVYNDDLRIIIDRFISLPPNNKISKLKENLEIILDRRSCKEV